MPTEKSMERAREFFGCGERHGARCADWRINDPHIYGCELLAMRDRALIDQAVEEERAVRRAILHKYGICEWIAQDAEVARLESQHAWLHDKAMNADAVNAALREENAEARGLLERFSKAPAMGSAAVRVLMQFQDEARAFLSRPAPEAIRALGKDKEDA